MARIPRPRGLRNNRNRLYTIASLVIVVVIIAYIYIPFGGSHSDPNNTGPIMNSNSATVHPDFPNASRQGAGNASLQNSLPDWESSSSGDNATEPQVQESTPQPEREAE